VSKVHFLDMTTPFERMVCGPSYGWIELEFQKKVLLPDRRARLEEMNQNPGYRSAHPGYALRALRQYPAGLVS
jgi:hypothetical protein